MSKNKNETDEVTLPNGKKVDLDSLDFEDLTEFLTMLGYGSMEIYLYKKVLEELADNGTAAGLKELLTYLKHEIAEGGQHIPSVENAIVKLIKNGYFSEDDLGVLVETYETCGAARGEIMRQIARLVQDGVPDKGGKWKNYLPWAVKAFGGERPHAIRVGKKFKAYSRELTNLVIDNEELKKETKIRFIREFGEEAKDEVLLRFRSHFGFDKENMIWDDGPKARLLCEIAGELKIAEAVPDLLRILMEKEPLHTFEGGDITLEYTLLKTHACIALKAMPEETCKHKETLAKMVEMSLQGEPEDCTGFENTGGFAIQLIGDLGVEDGIPMLIKALHSGRKDGYNEFLCNDAENALLAMPLKSCKQLMYTIKNEQLGPIQYFGAISALEKMFIQNYAARLESTAFFEKLRAEEAFGKKWNRSRLTIPNKDAERFISLLVSCIRGPEKRDIFPAINCVKTLWDMADKSSEKLEFASEKDKELVKWLKNTLYGLGEPLLNLLEEGEHNPRYTAFFTLNAMKYGFDDPRYLKYVRRSMQDKVGADEIKFELIRAIKDNKLSALLPEILGLADRFGYDLMVQDAVVACGEAAIQPIHEAVHTGRIDLNLGKELMGKLDKVISTDNGRIQETELPSDVKQVVCAQGASQNCLSRVGCAAHYGALISGSRT